MGAESEDNWLVPLFHPITSGECEICGELHTVEKCSLINGFTDYVRDSPSLSYARLTLPEGLAVRELSDGTKTVVTTKSFSKGIKFGPFIAKTSALIDVRIEFPIKVFLSEDESVYLETYEEIFCNWMCLVLPATRGEEQNLICFQIKSSVYFCSVRDIQEGEELRVWYSPYYAEKMGVHSLPKPADLIHSSDEEFKEIFESLQSGVEMQDHQYLPVKKKKRRPPKRLVLGENYHREVPVSDILPAELLGATRRSEWECSTCGQVELNVAAYARHLMTHYRPPQRPSFRCPHCNRNFRKDGVNRQVHTEVCRRKKLKESAQGEMSNQSTLSRMTFTVRTVDTNVEAASEIAQDCELPVVTDLWNKPVVFGNDKTMSNQNSNQSVDINDKTDILHSEALQSCKVDTPANVTTNDKNISISNNEWSITKQKDNLDVTNTETVKPVSLNTNGKNEQSKNTDENLGENLLVKSHLDPPILDLSDDIDFHLTKSLDEMINDDCNLDKSLPFAKNRNLDLFGVVESNLLASDVPNPHNSTIETTAFYSLEKNDFLQTDFASCNDVTDEERNRIVENLLSETDDKLFSSDYEMTDGCVSENPESQPKVGQQKDEKKAKKDKTGGDFKCDICAKSFTKPLYLFRHLRKHTGDFRCNTCFMVFARKENLQSHRMTCANEAETQQTIRRVRIRCKCCRLQFHSLPTFKEHMEKHYCTSNTWKCDCKFVSDSTDLFLNHNCKGFKRCTQCNICFLTLKDFKGHRNYPVSNVRKKGDSSRLCEFCGVVNLTITGARLHRNSHGPKSYECSVCGAGYARLENLKDHDMNKHGNIFWECSVCSKQFKSEKICNKHLKTMHTDPAFTCSHCEKKFRQMSNFKKHVKTHERKNKKCEKCDMEFSTTKLLKSHLVTGHQVFKCVVCDKVFASKWNLKIHRQKQHADSYKCVYCEMSIQFRSGLKKHLLNKHKNKKEEWDNPEALNNMQTFSAREADFQVEQEVGVVTANNNPSFSDILQTAADHVMEKGNLSMSTNVEEIEVADTQRTTIDQLPNTNFVTTTDASTPQDITFDINILQGSGNGPQLFNVDGEILSMPLAFVSDLPDSQPLTVPDEPSSATIDEAAMVSCPIVLPEGYMLLDNSLIAKQPSEENSTLINVSDFQATNGVPTDAYVLTDESVTDANLQIQNNVVFYIVDTPVPDAMQ